MTTDGRGPARLTLEVSPEREEELIAELWAFGHLLGVESRDGAGRARLDVYFERSPPADALEVAVRRCSAVLTGAGPIESRDWLADYRATCEPIEIGPLVIDPREPEAAAVPPDERVLRIPARNAFGTGSHESTRLILEGLLATELSGRSVLDVGTGSAILALAALRRGARRAVGCDLDVASVVTARDNCRLNRSWPLLLAGGAETLRGTFDVILVNILPHRWLAGAAAIVARLGERGELLVSGLLSREVDPSLARLEALGLAESERFHAGEWCALRLRRAPRGGA